MVKACSTAGSAIEFSFTGSDIYWRTVADKDGGKADVYLDGKLEKTVDLYFWDCELPFQFAFIKTGLDPKTPHTIKVAVRGNKNPHATGTVVRHMAFEHAAESWRASDGFCAIQGKNQWRYQCQEAGTPTCTDLTFWFHQDRNFKGYWHSGGQKGEDECSVHPSYQKPASRLTRGADVGRTSRWVRPHGR